MVVGHATRVSLPKNVFLNCFVYLSCKHNKFFQTLREPFTGQLWASCSKHAGSKNRIQWLEEKEKHYITHYTSLAVYSGILVSWDSFFSRKLNLNSLLQTAINQTQYGELPISKLYMAHGTIWSSLLGKSYMQKTKNKTEISMFFCAWKLHK